MAKDGIEQIAKNYLASISTAFRKNPSIGQELVFWTLPTQTKPEDFSKLVSDLSADADPQDIPVVQNLQLSLTSLRTLNQNPKAASYTDSYLREQHTNQLKKDQGCIIS